MKSSCSGQPHGHPCFDSKCHGEVGRIHLPVAPRCNIKCNYCSRKHDCANENRPGVTTKVISPKEAVARVREAIKLEPRIRVVGIAGPGDPLANDATFTTLYEVRREFRRLSLCLSTNGLLLPEKMEELVDLGLESLTVTVNTLNEYTGADIYKYVTWDGVALRGVEAAKTLREQQLEGIHAAVENGIRVKVNSVLLPGMNEHQMIPLARILRDMGVAVMNIMPLIPMAEFAHLKPVPPVLVEKIRQECEIYMPQIRHCRQCRADAAGLLGRDLQLVST